VIAANSPSVKPRGLFWEEGTEVQFSVGMLKEYWEKIDALAEGEALFSLSIFEMPPWNNLCSELSWEFHKIDSGYFSAKNHGFCGVYRLIALASEGDTTKPAVLNRVCGQDTTGTLYIGEAKSLSNRLNQLRRSARSWRPEGSHGAISMLGRISVLDFPLNKLGVALLFTMPHTKMVERHLIHAYMNSFGDAPPLNYRL
jgi:hypothetical protein